MIMRTLGLAAVALILAAEATHAQAAAARPTRDRAALEQQFRERTAALTRKRLGLTETQMTRLEQTNRRFALQFDQVASQERDTRRKLRQQLTSGNAANQQQVSDLLDAALRLQKQRIALVEAEQRELAGFLSPVQRARYIGLQAQFRRRAQELGRQNAGERGGRVPPRKSPAGSRLP